MLAGEDLADALVGHADEHADIANGEAFLAKQLRGLTPRDCWRDRHPLVRQRFHLPRKEEGMSQELEEIVPGLMVVHRGRRLIESAASEGVDNEQQGSPDPLTAGTEPPHETTIDNSPDRDHRAPTLPRAPP